MEHLWTVTFGGIKEFYLKEKLENIFTYYFLLAF